MPWNNNDGGGRGPWGQPPQRPNGGGGGGSQPPDLEEILRNGQQRLRRFFPNGRLGGGAWLLVLLVAFAAWAFTGIYRVRDAEMAVVLRFGEYVGTPRGPGLGFHLPYPIETRLIEDVQQLRRTDIGVSSNRSQSDVPEESLMLTGDENIIDIDFVVNWRVDAARVNEYLFNIREPRSTVKAVAESVMREVVGRNSSEYVRAVGRQQIANNVRERMQSTLDEYGAGITVEDVVITQAEPPVAVLEAFRDVQAAAADRDRFVEEARRYANQKVQQAEGSASRVKEIATADARSAVADAVGRASRFLAVYEQYRFAPDVTRRRLYLETMEKVLAEKPKVIIDSDGAAGQGVVPYLPLDQLTRQGGQARGGAQ